MQTQVISAIDSSRPSASLAFDLDTCADTIVVAAGVFVADIPAVSFAVAADDQVTISSSEIGFAFVHRSHQIRFMSKSWDIASQAM